MIELPQKLLISVNDVMPETLPAVRDIVERLERKGRGPVTLLVVPGRDWRTAELDELRRWQERGHELAGHGWSRSGPPSRGLWQRLPRPLAPSRQQAEHLVLDGAGIVRLIRRCRSWFDQHGLAAPKLYVPPARAMGRVHRLDIRALGFRFFEYAGGYYDARIGVFQRVPMLGFEADGALRALLARGLNRYAVTASHRYGWLRVAVHPGDPERRLATDLGAVIDALDGQPAFVTELFENGPPEAVPARSRRGVQAGEPSSVS
jgi:predicted deacetylase